MLPAQWCQQFVSWCFYQACVRARSRKEAAAEGWVEDPKGWKYRLAGGTYVKGAWKFINGRWYVFANDGMLIRGQWFCGDGLWYYLAADGGMLSKQWFCDQGKWYYLTESGAMAVNTYVKDARKDVWYWVDNEGAYDPAWDTEHPELGLLGCVN